MRDEEGAARTFAKVRQLEDTNVDGMDFYGQVLAQQSQLDSLNRLAVDMLDVDDKRPEAWTCLAIYHEARRDHEKALAFIDKAIMMDPKHAMSHKVKGAILLADSRPDHAAASFFRSNDICPDVPSYEGLVDAYLAAGKYKEAGMVAKEAISAAPRDPRAITLVGLALSEAVQHNQQAPENLVQAKRSLHKALAMDPSCRRPLIALVDIYVQEKNYSKAIELLCQGIEGTTESPCRLSAPDLFHAKLGQVYILCDRLQDASHAFHIACSLNPENRGECAASSVSRVVVLLRDEA
jgi:tetratricopeptide (TPR) repeat protein